MLQIELDIVNEKIDCTLVKYGGKTGSSIQIAEKTFTIVEYFEKWVKAYKQLDCDKNSDYFHLRNTLKKWGENPHSEMLSKLNAENSAPKHIMKDYPYSEGFQSG